MSMQKFNKIVKDIRSLKIQGAKDIAVEATKSLRQVIHSGNTKQQVLSRLKNAKKMLYESRPTEPAMRNAIFYTLSEIDKLDSAEEIISSVSRRIKEVLTYFEEAEKKIIEIGKNKIKDGYVVFTHCHSSTVVNILIEAKKQGKKFVVHNTETRPLLQGRITARELAKKGIKVMHYADSAARVALKKADIFLIGADAITSEGKIVNKIGSELFAESAERFGVPVYVCTHAWKYDPRTAFGFDEEIEMRQAKEIWNKPPKNVEVYNYAFEKVNPSLITGIISELGIYKPSMFVQEVLQNNSWMFDIK